MIKINYDLVEESLAEIEKMKLFTNKKNVVAGIIEFNDFEMCKEFAYEYDEYTFDDEYYNWQDIKELEMAKVKEKVYKNNNYKEINDELRKIGIKNASEISLSDECMEIWDDVYWDLITCIKVRGIVGKTNEFFEKIFQIYLSGGWPCGLEGNPCDYKIKAFYLK